MRLRARAGVLRRNLAGTAVLAAVGCFAPLARASTASELAATSISDEVFYHIFVRSFRDSDGDRHGDLRGIREKLDYLQELGVTSLLLTPLYPSEFYHNYFPTDFEGIDREFGDMAAFRELVAGLHARNMKIYLDQEIQYVAEGHPWLQDSLGRPDSRYSRHVIYNAPDNREPESGPFGVTALLTYTGSSIPIATVNLHDGEVRQYFADFFLSWIDPNRDGRFEDGVDGFRIDHMMDDLDAKGKVTGLFDGFWAPIFEQLRATNPRVTIIAEQADWGYGDDFLTRGGVDAVFAFPLRQAILAFDRGAIVEAMTTTANKTPAGKRQLVFIENHDTNRFTSEVEGDLRKAKVGAALNLLLPGTPLLYYGQEIGMRGKQSKAWGSDANDIPVREAFEWARRQDGAGAPLWYRETGAWWTDRFNRDDDGISVEEQHGDAESLLSFYRRLFALRHARPELRAGDWRVLTTNSDDVLAVRRTTQDRTSLLLANLADRPAQVIVKSEDAGPWAPGQQLKDLISDHTVTFDGAGVHMDLLAFGVALLAPP
jgi:alpha-amylase